MSGQAPPRGVQSVVMGQPRQGLTPPGRVAKPGDCGREGQDRRPGLQGRPYPGPRPVGGTNRPQAPHNPDPRGRSRTAREVAGRAMDEEIRMPRWGQQPVQPEDLAIRQPQGSELAAVVNMPSIQSARPGGRRRSGRCRRRARAGAAAGRSTAAIFSTKARPISTPTRTRQRRASGSCSPFQNATAVAAQSRRPGVSVPAMWPSP